MYLQIVAVCDKEREWRGSEEGRVGERRREERREDKSEGEKEKGRVGERE